MTNADSRREDIANYVIKLGHARIDELVERFAVSRMTVHRHVEQLAQQGILRKLHGAVTAQPSSVYESTFRYRAGVCAGEKRSLAMAAAEYIEAGQSVMLDDSTTASAIVPLLRDIKPLTVITNSLMTATLLAEGDGVDFYCLGGQYHVTYNAFIGIICENAIAQLHSDVLICSASAVSGTTAFIQDQQVVRIKQAMMAASSKRILLVDHHKFRNVALHMFDELKSFDAVLVTDGIGDAQAHELRNAGVRLRIVGVSE